MAKEELFFSVPINEKIEQALKEAYEDYLTKAEEPVLTVEEFNVHILKLGILTNEIEKKEIEYNNKKEEASNVKSELAQLKKEYRNNRIKIKTKYDFESIY